MLTTQAAVHGHGVALGDTVTARGLLDRGQLVTPFNLSVPAVYAFYVACRNEMRSAPIAQGVHRLAVCRAAGKRRPNRSAGEPARSASASGGRRKLSRQPIQA